MTGRGRGVAPPLRPVTPLNPSLAVRPVPHTRKFPMRSFGPAAAGDTAATIKSVESLDGMAESDKYGRLGDDHRDLLELVERRDGVSFRHDEAPVARETTWEYYVFLIGYSPVVRV